MPEQMLGKHHAQWCRPISFSAEGNSDHNHDHYTTQSDPLVSRYAHVGTVRWFRLGPLYKTTYQEITEELDFAVYSTCTQWWRCVRDVSYGHIYHSTHVEVRRKLCPELKLGSSVLHSKHHSPLSRHISPRFKVLIEQMMTPLREEGIL